jgi:type IV pilus assembly protein PilY1
MNLKSLVATVVAAVALSYSAASLGQTTTIKEDFTGTTSANNWFFFNGACLTAGTGTGSPGASPGLLPSCIQVYNSYYGVANSLTGKVVDNNMYGGYAGYLGSSSKPSNGAITADPVGVMVNGVATNEGALRFTNGNPGGYHENGAIVSAFTFPSGQGLQISFKTLTYLGNSGGSGKDGADGISFYLLDGCMPVAGGSTSSIAGAAVPSGCGTSPIYGTSTFPGIGAWGGSLAYTCSNGNSPFDGLVGAYLGLGIDEYGNFLNGTTNTLGESGTSATGDNTASGGGYQPGRIGLRGAGSITWQALTNAYGTATTSGPYYPASLGTTCSNGATYTAATNTCGVVCSNGGTYNSSSNSCGDTCNSGYTFSTSNNLCNTCSGTATYTASTNSCSPAYTCSSGTYDSTANACSPLCSTGTLNTYSGTCQVCSGSQTFDPAHSSTPKTYPCASCSSGSYSTTNGKCGTKSATWNKPSSSTAENLPSATLITQSPTTGTVQTGSPLFLAAVKKACSTGHLWNYTTPTSPTDAGTATLTTDPNNPNPLNTAGILDYPAIPGAYSVIPTSGTGSFQIATESATTRAQASPILYNLKITQDGLLSLSYSYNGGAAVTVISSQKITDSNGPLPGSFRFGFAGSTGGSNNVHEILCFKAAPVATSGSSGTVNVYQNPTLHPLQQFFLANYYPSDWTGQLTAIGLYYDTVNQTLAENAAPTWDARCVLTGVSSSLNPCSTGATSLAAQQWNNTTGSTSGGRVMLTWDPVAKTGEAFQWASITAAQQTALGAQSRLNYLRGDRSNEITTGGSGLYRARDAVLSDIVDSSPNWIGPPQNAYSLVSQWMDMVYPTQTAPENATGAQTYAQFMAAQSSTNANGELQRANVVYAGANDGFLHGFRAGALDANGNLVTTNTPNDGYEVLAYMPGAILANIHSSSSALDFSNTQYAHAWFVDAPPASGDLFYGAKWHTWVVGGLGAGGSAIYALDVTDPANFSEGNASTIVKGEWTPSNLTCVTTTTNTNSVSCGTYLGNTYGTPQIRRFHSGQWGFIFGNGFNNAKGASGIYIALLNSTTGVPTFYWLPTNLTFSATTDNGIGTVEPADYDLDHTTDYIYAGDLLGNLWKFDVTSNDPTKWAVSSSSPLFSGGGGMPISTQPQVSTVKTITTVQNAVGLDVSNAPQRVIINFGTGQQIPQSTTSPATYVAGPQYMVGVWDWDMTGWNTLSTFQPGIGLSSGPEPMTTDNMTEQTLTETLSVNGSTGTASLTQLPVCWQGSSTCNGSNNKYGWFTQLPSTNEQIIFDPFVSKIDGSLNFNTFIPATTTLLSCTDGTSQGFSLGMDASTGGGLSTPLFNIGGANYDGVQTNAIGTGTMLNAGTVGGGKNYLITHSACTGTACQGLNFTQTNTYTVTTGQRVYWIQKR